MRKITQHRGSAIGRKTSLCASLARDAGGVAAVWVDERASLVASPEWRAPSLPSPSALLDAQRGMFHEFKCFGVRRAASALGSKTLIGSLAESPLFVWSSRNS